MFVVDMANAWPNYGVGIFWLLVFIAFVIGKYPHKKGGNQR